MESFTVSQTNEAYKKSLEEVLQNYPGANLSLYQEGKIIEKLLKEGHESNNLKETVAELSPIANQPGKIASNYAANVITKTEESISALSEILEVKMNINELMNEASTVSNEPRTIPYFEVSEYRVYAKELLDSNHQLNSSFDTKIGNKMLQVGYSKEEVKNAIMEASPIAKEASRNTENYANYITNIASEKHIKYLDHIKNLEANYDKAATAYINKVQAIQTANPTREYSNYWDGRVISEMLKEGFERENVHRAIREISPVAQNLHEEKGVEPERYAKRIVYQIVKSNERYDAAYFLEPKVSPDLKSEYATEEYKHQLKKFINDNANPNPFVDTQISKSMLALEYQQSDIEKALIEASPVSIEPGRITERYASSIVSQAVEQLNKQQFIQQERQILKEIAEAPEVKDLKKEPVAKELYNSYAKEAIAVAGGKWNESLDMQIAINMMKNNVRETRISSALKNSPSLVGKDNKEKGKIIKTSLADVKKNHSELNQSKKRTVKM